MCTIRSAYGFLDSLQKLPGLNFSLLIVYETGEVAGHMKVPFRVLAVRVYH